VTPDLVIIGAGAVGLACAAEASARGLRTILVERHDSFGQDTSSRNSEVIHSGIYYTPGSLKAKLCVAANRWMYDYCAAHDVWTNRCGKLVVAVGDAEIPRIEEIHRRGETNGVEGLRMLSGADAKKLEPKISCAAALLVPSAGIVDSHGLLRSYLAEAKAGGAEIVYGVTHVAAVKTPGGDTASGSGARTPGGYTLRMKERGAGHDGDTEITTPRVINAAGLCAGQVAASFGIDIDAAGYRIHPNRGHYYVIASPGGPPISRLVYPVPPANLTSLGLHLSIDRGGRCRAGPDAEYIDPSTPEQEWYRFDESRRGKFFDAVVRYMPSLRMEELSPDQVGVRAKVQKAGDPMGDFIIREESDRGLPGLVNLVGIESPGLTSSREIAKLAVQLLK
jgi:L-2-hydroxyglutarate oxidase LhgO